MNLHQMLHNVSRTFAISIERLPASLRESVMLSYLLLRVSDCLEDNETLSAEYKTELLHLWVQVLKKEMPVTSLTKKITHLDSSDPEVYVAQSADQLIEALEQLPEKTQKIIISHVVQSSLGMARWQEHGPIVNTEEEMDDYMYQVAGRVGHLLTDLFGCYSPAFQKKETIMRPLARHFGLALQTVNIIRGLRKDYERGWVFVPRTFYEPLGLTKDSLFAQENTNRAMDVVNLLANKAETHLEHGLEYIITIPQNHHGIRLACMWPLFFAKKTLALSRNNMQVILSGAKITRADVLSIVRQTTLMGWSNQWLRNYYLRLQSI
ncbi:MAG: squalene/phytoene synthase family protein [Chloroflexi bacterium]|nr:squalene/phytoene synthase family protein [Chloroflexota bacterium]